MRIKTQTIEIPLESLYANDKLRRKESVENLSNLLAKVETPVVASVNATWGAGKTTFLKMMHGHLLSQEISAVYFSAWETDFASDPLLAFLGEINIFLSEQLLDNERAKAWARAKTAGAYLLKRVIPAAVKVGTAGILDINEIIEEEASNLAESLSNDLIESYVTGKEQIAVFKENVRRVLQQEGGEAKRLCIFVDELDRCRPTYAIELLERIKHLLDIPGLVFVLALDKAQLSHSVKAVYGSEFDATGYLKRFIDFEYSLPAPNIDVFVNYLFSHNEFSEYFSSSGRRELYEDGRSLLSGMQLLAKSQNLSLRSIEQLFTRLKLILLSVPCSHEFHPELTLYLIYLRDFDKFAYDAFVIGGSEAQKAIDLLPRIIKKDHDSYEIFCQFVHAGILAAQKGIDDEWVAQQIASLQQEAKAATDESSKYYINRVIELQEWFSGNRSGRRIRIKSLINRVEMLENFQI